MSVDLRMSALNNTRNEKENVSLNVLVMKQTPHGSDGKEVNMGLLGPNYFRI